VPDFGKLLGIDEVIRMIWIVAFEADPFRHEPPDIGARGRRHVLASRSVANLALHVAQRLLRHSDLVPVRRPVPHHVAGDATRLIMPVHVQ